MPKLEPLQLLYVTNGSPLTADRWWQAHHYYQHRQNLHYQSLHQPGIVCGLGVRVIPAPASMPAELRDRRWVEIQPGIAIDLVGNPIVVDEPVTFRITSEVIEAPVTVYIVLAYVNPRAKEWSGIPTNVVKEEFRINERTTPPAPDEVELCRIQLNHNWKPLKDAAQVMHPAPQALDLRSRQQVRVRSQQPVQVGLVNQPAASPYHDRLTALLQSIDGLYPPLSGSVTVPNVALIRSPPPNDCACTTVTNIGAFTVLFLPYETAIALTDSEIERLQQYIAQGSTLFIEYTDEHQNNTPSLGELKAVQAELLAALVDLQDVEVDTELDRISQELTDELTACEAACQAQLQAIAHPIQRLAQPPGDTGEAQPNHLASSMFTGHPFLFDELPHLPTGPIHLLAWDGIVLVVGSLTAAWTRQQFERPLPRSTLRSAQELGINLLYHASRRQQLVQAQQVPA